MNSDVRAEFDVSVVIPAYRAAGFIDSAIDSAFGQRGVSVEVVVVDDACPEQSGNAVVARYGCRPDLAVLRLPRNEGPAGARNAGFAASRGVWIAVLDADDEYVDGRLARLVQTASSLSADIIADNVCYFDRPSGSLSEPKLKSVVAPTRLDVHSFAAGARPGTGELDFGLLKPMFRKDFVVTSDLHYPADVRHGEDFLLYLEAIHRGANFYVIPEPGYIWSLRNSGHSQTQVNYTSQVADINILKSRPWVRDDALLSDLLDMRAAALVRHQETSLYVDAVRSGRYLRALATCLRRPFLFRHAARSVASRLGVAQ